MSESPTSLMACVGCGGRVPDVAGPTHDYMLASPGCWQRYGTIVASAGPAFHVDCYAAQHPGGADLDWRQRASVAVHLTALCLLLDHGLPAHRTTALRGRMSRTVLPRLGLTDWPHLTPPSTVGTTTVADLTAGDDLLPWARSVWTAWAEHHDTVGRWARTVLA